VDGPREPSAALVLHLLTPENSFHNARIRRLAAMLLLSSIIGSPWVQTTIKGAKGWKSAEAIVPYLSSAFPLVDLALRTVFITTIGVISVSSIVRKIAWFAIQLFAKFLILDASLWEDCLWTFSALVFQTGSGWYEQVTLNLLALLTSVPCTG